VRDLDGRQILGVTQPQGGVLVVGENASGRVPQIVDVVLPLGKHGSARFPGIASGFIQGHVPRSASPAPGVVVRQSNRDRVQPGRKPIALIEAIDMLKGSCQSFLDEVLGVGIAVTQPIAKEIQQARTIAIRELGERVLAAIPGAPNQFVGFDRAQVQ
jgi:hypothetical protein